ncbi:PAS domain-containing protein [Zooshikella marina]|uniref:PAS domain-containing protein n=1 Tax=Zooshikella ganghwensis TaxID=202772 RepID=UPI001BAE9A63|nr:PAS domain-containing protein [Zooshikella ganghwensis]MBU2708209.1 PAS domain-containing protein [Zooshikella ganghwensis]
MEFTQKNLSQALSETDESELDSARFGIVKLDPEGKVEFYNKYESELAGLSVDQVLGQNFFTQVAPCTNNYMVSHKFNAAVENNTDLDETLDYIFTYKLKPTNVKLRLLKYRNNQWLCVAKQ